MKNNHLKLTSLSDLKEDTIKELTNDSTLVRGLAYFDKGRIVNPILWDQTIQAEVVGSGLSNYITSVEIKDSKLKASCNCPSEEHFCKHAVALLYAWIKTPEVFKEITKIRSSLERVSKEELVEILIKMIKKEPSIISRLNLYTSQTVCESRKYGDEAILPLGFELKSYQQLNNLLAKLREIKDIAHNYFEKADFQNGLKILQSIIQQSITNYRKRYDVDGLFGEFIEECLHDYSKVSAKFNIPQKEAFFNDFIRLYIQDTGGFTPEIAKLILTQCNNQADYDKLEGVILGKLPELQEEEQKESIIELLLEVYDKKGDDERYLEVCKANLNDWRNYVRLCDKLCRLGREEEAIQWYQKAINASSEKYPSLIFKKKLALLYENTNNLNEALNLYFDIFKEKSDLESYKKIKNLAKKLDKEEKIKNKIFLFLAKEKKYPLLIEILLYEKNIDMALKIALLPNQRVTDIKKVARQAVNKKPIQAIRLLKRFIDYYINLKRREDYRIAKEYCRQVKRLYKKLNQEHVFDRYIARIKKLNAGKKLLLEELEEI